MDIMTILFRRHCNTRTPTAKRLKYGGRLTVTAKLGRKLQVTLNL